jgi:hypothetical protein
MVALISKGVFQNLPGEFRYLIIMALFAALATVAGVVAARLVERPTLVIRDRLFPARSRKIVSAPSPRAHEEREGSDGVASETDDDPQGLPIDSIDSVDLPDEPETIPAHSRINIAE